MTSTLHHHLAGSHRLGLNTGTPLLPRLVRQPDMRYILSLRPPAVTAPKPVQSLGIPRRFPTSPTPKLALKVSPKPAAAPVVTISTPKQSVVVLTISLPALPLPRFLLAQAEQTQKQTAALVPAHAAHGWTACPPDLATLLAAVSHLLAPRPRPRSRQRPRSSSSSTSHTTKSAAFIPATPPTYFEAEFASMLGVGDADAAKTLRPLAIAAKAQRVLGEYPQPAQAQAHTELAAAVVEAADGKKKRRGWRERLGIRHSSSGRHVRTVSGGSQGSGGSVSGSASEGEGDGHGHHGMGKKHGWRKLRPKLRV
ncbi:hypothetical protein EDC01DRAFT_447482 [Geopyxis carbonaria]|nr:hypothetical protein EDC01DRAFT_447482 [Geopyxis carbonaria]